MRKSLVPQTPTIKQPNESSVPKNPNYKIPLYDSPPGKKRTSTKIDLKLQYIQNQIQQAHSFRDFLHNINFSTKALINPQLPKPVQNPNITPRNKIRNSFILNQQTFKNTLNDLQKHNVVNSQNAAIQPTKSPNQQQTNQIQPQSQQIPLQKTIDLSQLQQITKLIQQRNFILNKEIHKIKEKMLHSSISQDKPFYDSIQVNYGLKMTEIEERLQKSQKNLQQKQKLKKITPQTQQVSIRPIPIIRYGLYQADKKQGEAVAQYFDVKAKIANQLKLINRIYTNYQTLQQRNASNVQTQNKKDTEQYLRNQSSPENDQIQQHPLICSAKLMKSQFQKFADLIKAYRTQSKKKHQKYKNQPTDIVILLYHKVRTINKEILKEQLNLTQKKISKLKHQTETIQNGIKELQAFKALTLLRNKAIEEKTNKEKKLSKGGNKNNMDQEVLKIILEHQFFVKTKTLRIETKFSGVDKKIVRSNSDRVMKREEKLFKFKIVQRKCKSLDFFRYSERSSVNQKIQSLKENKTARLQKKLGLEVTSGYLKKKQVGSSASTNL